MQKKNLVLGVIDSYSFPIIALFCKSLSVLPSNTNTVLFVGPNIHPVTLRHVQRHGIKIVRYSQDSIAFNDGSPVQIPKFYQSLHIFNLRHYLYLEYIRRTKLLYDYVFLTDVRDVIFQADPFVHMRPGKIYVAVENTDIKIFNEHYTYGEIKKSFSSETLALIRNKDVICAGTISSDINTLEAYLSILLGLVSSLPPRPICDDQGIHNVLTHRESSPFVFAKQYNGLGIISTLGTDPSYRLSSDGYVLNKDGSRCPVVHQYDRHKYLSHLFSRRLLGVFGYSVIRGLYRAERIFFAIINKMTSVRNQVCPAVKY